MLTLEKKEIRERIEQKLKIDFLSEFQKNFLTSILWKIEKGWEITEKQSRVLNQIFKKLDEAEIHGLIWKLSEKEKEEVKLVLDLSKGYSSYYLSNHNPSLQKAIRGLLEIQLKSSVGQSLISTERVHLEVAKKIMKKRIEHLQKPKFTISELVLSGSKKSVGVVIDGPAVSKNGQIQYTVDFLGRQVSCQVDELKKICKAKRSKQEQSASDSEQ